MSRLWIHVGLLATIGCAAGSTAPSTSRPPEAAREDIPAPACAAEVASSGTARLDVPQKLPAGRGATIRMRDVRTTTAASLTVHLMGPSGQIAKFPASVQPAFEHRWLLGCDYGSTPPEPPTCRRPLQPGELEEAYVSPVELAPDLLRPGRYALHVCGPLEVPPHPFEVL